MSARRRVGIARASITLALAVGLALPAAAADDAVPIATRFGVERVRLPQGERMGLTSATLLFDIGHDWSLGPSIYGAASGGRGGFFVGGLEVQRGWRLAPRWTLTTGLYAGGGGGAAAPVGDGLMLRPAIALLRDLGDTWQAGVSWSLVRFPSGEISSPQLGILIGWRGAFRDTAAADNDPSGSASGLGFNRLAITTASYRLRDGSGRRIGLVGARAEHPSGLDGLHWGLEAAAAAKGDAAGYMELLGAAAYELPLGPTPLRGGVRASLGLGGGGAVPTGGGVIAKLVGTLQWRFAPGWTLGGDYGWVMGTNGPLRARQAGLWIAAALEPGVDDLDDRSARPGRIEWLGVLQHHARIERRDGTRGSLDTIGLQLNRYLGEHLYLSGQAHSAYAGGAGAYSVGLLGAGLATSLGERWRVGGELLVGAAGGGGVDTAGGAVAQGVFWSGWNTPSQGEWRLGLGAMRPWRGGRVSPTLELVWGRSFGAAER